MKNPATQKKKKKYYRGYFKVSKMTVGTGSWRPAAENAIPCVEIEQRRGKKPKKVAK